MALTIDELNIQIASDSSKASRALTSLIKKLEQLKTALSDGKTGNITITNSFNQTTNAVKKSTNATQKDTKEKNKNTNATKKHGNASKTAAKHTRSFSDTLAYQITKFRTLFGVFQNAANTMSEWFAESNDYVETLNLFNVTMGDAAVGAKAFAQSVQDLMGIDAAEWMQNQGVFKNLVSGFGVAEEASNVMSQNLTQLSYDMASFFNTDVETAFDKLSSAMSGQVKGLREFGIDTTVASLQEYALSKGIDAKVRSMTQAEKSMLRYNYIMEKSIIMQGDMARTIITPANALRVLSAQFTLLKRSLGNIISVIATQFIPYVQAMVEMLREAADSVAAFFGFELPEIDYSSLDTGGFADDLEDAEDSVEGVSGTLKKIKKQLMGFDELNIISDPSSSDSGSSGATGAGAGLNMKPLSYDFLAGLETKNLDEIKEKLKSIMEVAKWVGIIIGGWTLGKFITSLVMAGAEATGLKESLALLGKSLAITASVTLVIAGIAWFIDTSIDAWKDGLGIPEFGELMASAGFTTGAASLLGLSLAKAMGKPLGQFAAIGAGISLTATGIGMIVVGVKDLITNGPTLSNVLTTVAGAISVVAGVTLILSKSLGTAFLSMLSLVGGIALIIVGVTAVIAGVVDLIKNGPTLTNILTILGGAVAIVVGVCLAWNAALLANPITWIIIGIMALVAAIVLCITYWDEIVAVIKKAWAWIVDLFSGVGSWIYNSILTPIGHFFVKCWDGIVAGAKAAWNGIKQAFAAVGSFFVGLWDSIKKIFSNIGSTIGSAVSNAFGEAVNTVLRTAVNIVNGFFSAINTAIGFINKIPGVNIKAIAKLQVPQMASGGFVSEGQMFIAREAGPELVGSIGRKTAVANNDQIVSGIESGVYRAMMAANSTGNGGTQTIRIINEIDGDVVGEKVIKYHNGKVLQTGESPLLV